MVLFKGNRRHRSAGASTTRQVPLSLFTKQPPVRSAPAPSSVTPQPAARPRQGPAVPLCSETPIFVKFQLAFQLDLEAEHLSL